MIRQDFPFSDSEVPFQSNSGGGHVYSNYLEQGLRTFENGFNATTEHALRHTISDAEGRVYVCLRITLCSGIMLYA